MDLSDKVGISFGMIIVALLLAAVIGKLVWWPILLLMLACVIIFAALRWYAAIRKEANNKAISAMEALKTAIMGGSGSG